MVFIEAVKVCLIGKYDKFKGRASRSEFWYFVLASAIYIFVAGVLLGLVGVSDEVFDLAYLILIIPILLPTITVSARRLHDINQSGWMQCIFIPGSFADEFLGTGYVILIMTLGLWAFWFSQAGKRGKNKYGAQPRK